MAKRTRQDPLKPRKAPKVTEEKIAAHNQAENDCFTRTFGEQRAEEIGILAGQMDARIIETSSKTHEYLQRVTTSTLKGHALDTNDNESWALKNKLAEAVKKSNVDFTVLQRSLSGYMNAYKDVYHMHATHESDKEICQLMALHAWNHVFKTRDRILKNTAKLAADPETAGECRDQGFTRPKILILAPFRQHALDIINALIQFSGTETQENDKRFFTEFDQPEQEPDERKPQDFNDTFRGNIDDCFRIGLKYNRKQLKMFSSFFSSDIIIASPLGLQMILGKKDKEKDDDFLSSIEVVFMYHAEVFMMQNWQHVKSVFDHINKIPKDSHGCDFSRVKSYCLDGRQKYVRQNIFFSQIPSPSLNALISKYTHNINGSVKITRAYSGLLSNVTNPVPQVFQKIPSCKIIELGDNRFKYFSEKLIPGLIKKSNVAIVFPEYVDFVRVKEYLDLINIEYESICEYDTKADVDRARHYFKDEGNILLYTERAHFFRRYRIPSVLHIVFYQPLNFGFYPELVNQVSQDGTCTTLLSIYDQHALERTIGSEKCKIVLKSEKEAFMFTL